MATTMVITNKKKTFLSSLVHRHGRHGHIPEQPRVVDQDSVITGGYEQPTIRVVPYEHRAAACDTITPAADVDPGLIGTAVDNYDNKAIAKTTASTPKILETAENPWYHEPALESVGSGGSFRDDHPLTSGNQAERGSRTALTTSLIDANAITRQQGRSVTGSTHVPKSKTSALGPLQMNPPKLAPSVTMPLGIFSQPIETDEVGEKTEKMLKATEELKPSAQPKGLTSSTTTSTIAWVMRKNGLIRRVFSNSLTERFQGKSHAKDDNKDQDGSEEQSGKPLCLRERLSPIGTVELRLNEGENLSRRKVQQMVGACMCRSARRGDKTPQRPELLDDPFSDVPDARRAPTEFENRLRANSEGSSILSRRALKNPFESERILESNIDSFLSDPPVASSTPPQRYDHAYLFGASGSPVRMSRTPRVCGSDASDENLDGPSGQTKILKSRYTPAVEYRDAGIKKHPSPAKHDLEALGHEFKRRYLDNGVVRDDGDGGDFETTEAMNRACKAVHRSVVLIPDAWGSSMFYAPSSALVRSQTEARITSFLQPPHMGRMDSLNLEIPFHSGSNEVF